MKLQRVIWWANNEEIIRKMKAQPNHIYRAFCKKEKQAVEDKYPGFVVPDISATAPFHHCRGTSQLNR